MLERIIAYRRREAIDSILRHYRDRYHEHVILVPSASFGIYAAARELLRPGDRVIISAITCRVVIAALLRAGVTPVLVDIEGESGNIDPAKLRPAILENSRAIITTNLYGNPDAALELKRLASAYSLLLIEDCAHVLHTTLEGQLIGSIGDVAIFSFRKYFNEPGGVIALRNGDSARKIALRVQAETTEQHREAERLRYMQWLVRRNASPRIATLASTIFRRWRGYTPFNETRKGNPAPVADLFPTTASLLNTAGALARWEMLVRDRAVAARNLISRCSLQPKISRYSSDVCYMVVPFFCSRRDEVISAVEKCGIPTYFLYFPPMNRLFNQFVPPSGLDTELLDRWSRSILPINVRFASEYLEAVNSLL